MSWMKRYAEEIEMVSEEMGLPADDERVRSEAQRRVTAARKESENLARQSASEFAEEQCRQQAGSLVNYDGYPCQHGEYCSDCGEHIMDCCCPS